MNEPTTNPPPSPEARALRAIDQNLDALGQIASELASKVGTLTELGENDSAVLRGVARDVAEILTILKNDSARLGELEAWRGDHMRDHARQ